MSVRHALLALLSEGPKYGLQLRQEFEARTGEVWPLNVCQVYTTLHTNSAVGAIPRLLDIGIVPDIMSGNIIGIVAQRLVRKLCKHCKQDID